MNVDDDDDDDDVDVEAMRERRTSVVRPFPLHIARSSSH
jgi:hypothetical protein